MATPRKKKVLVIGVDCVPPKLLYEELIDDLPNLKRWLGAAAHGAMQSVHPPITCPAWACMMTGRDPGELGIYGFRNRSGFGYADLKLVSSRDVRHPALWDTLSLAGKKVVTVGVPPAYPPKRVNGWSVGCIMTPGIDTACTYPPELKEELVSVVPSYKFDIDEFRTDAKDRVLEELYEMTRMHFRLIGHLITSKPWDFFMFVEIGTDRLHHGFWKYFDPAHPKYVPGNRYERAVRDYYRSLDHEIGKVLELLDGNTTVFLVSDHGAKPLFGGIAVNQFLINEGYLKLNRSVRDGIRWLEPDDIDWTRTKAWSEGGYYARIFLNVEGREPGGIVPKSSYPELREELKAKILSIRRPDGSAMDNVVMYPENIYREVAGVAPDLMVYFDNLNWRSIGTVGYPAIHVTENDSGPDDANHSQYGIFAVNDGTGHGKKLADTRIGDVRRLVLREFGLR